MSANVELLVTTIQLVRARGDMTLREVAEGSDVDFEWLSKFAREEISDPGVRKVQRVHDFLLPRVVLPRKRAGSRARVN